MFFISIFKTSNFLIYKENISKKKTLKIYIYLNIYQYNKHSKQKLSKHLKTYIKAQHLKDKTSTIMFLY
jgi:hypothetical protein